jgi:hypothetical protein
VGPFDCREVATEFIERRRTTMRELMSFRRLPRLLQNLRMAILAAVQERRRTRECMNERMEA